MALSGCRDAVFPAFAGVFVEWLRLLARSPVRLILAIASPRRLADPRHALEPALKHGLATWL